MGNMKSMDLLNKGKLTKAEKMKRTKIKTARNMSETEVVVCGRFTFNLSCCLTEVPTWISKARGGLQARRMS